MDYEKIYKNIYSKFYDELELKATEFYIYKKSKRNNHNYAHNEFNSFIYNDFCKNILLQKTESLKDLYHIFQNRANYCDEGQIQYVFENNIREGFEKINFSLLPDTYNYYNLIEDIAFIESRNEISRLLTIQYDYFRLIYKYNRFDIMKIREYPGKKIEDYPYYQELYLLSHKDDYVHEKEKIAIENQSNESKSNFSVTTSEITPSPVYSQKKSKKNSNEGNLGQTTLPKSDITIKVIALLYGFNGNVITRENATAIAKKYHYCSKLSGEGLYQKFSYYSDRSNRLASGESKTKCKNKIKLFEKVIELLEEGHNKERAISELAIVKSKLHNYK